MFALEFTLIITWGGGESNPINNKKHTVSKIFPKPRPLMPGSTRHKEAQLPHVGLVVTGFDLHVSGALRMSSDADRGQVW